MTTVNVVIDGTTEGVHWIPKELPDCLTNWHRVFVGTPAPALRFGKQIEVESLFEKYRIDGKLGALVLVRPDGHMSAIEYPTVTGIESIKNFFDI